ncbi:MAG: hypothetical protein ACKVPX_01250 [Myxococcaceae bacterium]
MTSTALGSLNAERTSAALQRIRAEYTHLPRLSLTIDQAKRLWSLDEPTAAVLLGHLAGTEAFLCKDTSGRYRRTQ